MDRDHYIQVIREDLEKLITASEGHLSAAHELPLLQVIIDFVLTGYADADLTIMLARQIYDELDAILQGFADITIELLNHKSLTAILTTKNGARAIGQLERADISPSRSERLNKD